MDWGIELQEMVSNFVQFLPSLIAALVIFVVALAVAGMASRAVKKALAPRVASAEVLLLLGRLTRWSVLLLGTLTALEQVNFDVTSFVAGLGVVGFTAGFALQDIARNFVSGIILLIRQPFEIGNAVDVAGHSGTVLDISMRDTVLKTFDGEQVIIPNIDVFNSSIINYSALALRRRTVAIGLGYGEDVSRATGVFVAAINSVEGVLDDPAASVQVDSLGDSALTMLARFWVNQEESSLLDVHSAVVQAIKEAAEKEGIDLPYPTQTLRIEGDWPKQ